MRCKAILSAITGVFAMGLIIGPVSAHAAAYKEAPVSNGGSITGKVEFKGTLPVDAVEKIVINKNPEVCGEGYREVVWVDVKGKALRGAFVYIDKINEGKPWPVPEGGKALINQQDCRFKPWAQVIKPGEVIVRNSDKGVLHNINTREMIGVEKGNPVRKVIFNFGQPDPGDLVKDLKPRRSPHISVNCEAHNFMFGFMMAPDHPYAEVVGDDGSFAIKNIPPGTYAVKAWHPRLGIQESKITVTANKASSVDFEFTSK